MKAPFVFGKLAEGKEFTNREQETKTLIENFDAGINTIIISPRRWGKSSLVKHATEKLKRKDKNVLVIYIDLFNLKTEDEFYKVLLNKVIQSTTQKWKTFIQNSGQFFKGLIPVISYSPIPDSEFSMSLNWEEVSKSPAEVLNLPEEICRKKKYKMVICIDEFQNISFFRDPLGFQKKLRAAWQKHHHVVYCLYGSKEHMMQEVFNDHSMPFYRFGTIMNLQKIKKDKWITFIVKRFRETGKLIEPENAHYIIELSENHPYYVQQLAKLSWMRTEDNCQKENIDLAMDQLLDQVSPFYIRETDALTVNQLNLLRAILSQEVQLSSQATIRKYKLRSTSNVDKIKKAMIEKEILRFESGQAEFLDPLFGIWLKLRYFI